MSQRAKRHRWYALIVVGQLLALTAVQAAEPVSSPTKGATVLPTDRGGRGSDLPGPDPAFQTEMRAAKGGTANPATSAEIPPLPFALDDLLGGERKPVAGDVQGEVVKRAAVAEFLLHELTFTAGNEVYGSRSMPGWLVGDKLRRIGSPAALAVNGRHLFVVDEMSNVVFKIDLAARTVWPIVDLSVEFSGNAGGIFASADGAFYISDERNARVVKYTPSGEKGQVYLAPNNLARPGRLFVNASNGHLFVIDKVFSRILVFNRYGEPIYVIGSRGMDEGHFVDPTAFLVDAGHIYVADAIGVPVQQLSLLGNTEQTFGTDSLYNPSAVAVDRYGRVFVADVADNFIKIYQSGKLVGKFGGSGIDPGKFREIQDMAIADDRLYVAESLNRRLQVFKILPP